MTTCMNKPEFRQDLRSLSLPALGLELVLSLNDEILTWGKERKEAGLPATRYLVCVRGLIEAQILQIHSSQRSFSCSFSPPERNT